MAAITAFTVVKTAKPPNHHRRSSIWSGDENNQHLPSPTSRNLSSFASSYICCHRRLLPSSPVSLIRPHLKPFSSHCLPLRASLQDSDGSSPTTSKKLFFSDWQASHHAPAGCIFLLQVEGRFFRAGLSFRTTEEGLRNAFQSFGDLVDVKLVMDNLANRSRGFAFLQYATEEQSAKAIEGMHGKFLDGRVIFVEVAKPRSELRQDLKQKQTRY